MHIYGDKICGRFCLFVEFVGKIVYCLFAHIFENGKYSDYFPYVSEYNVRLPEKHHIC